MFLESVDFCFPAHDPVVVDDDAVRTVQWKITVAMFVVCKSAKIPGMCKFTIINYEIQILFDAESQSIDI